ncbi:hypothetical protein C8R42DRAFT_714920 [Lentinula raphanica]|nr:hypothetical protein C8R42DRAFT_714920 [Lentinula raphanica]
MHSSICDDGTVGRGGCTLECHTEAFERISSDPARERFIGAVADDIEDIWQTAYVERFYRGASVFMLHLELILPSAIAIPKSKPVWQLLAGRALDRIILYCASRATVERVQQFDKSTSSTPTSLRNSFSSCSRLPLMEPVSTGA